MPGRPLNPVLPLPRQWSRRDERARSGQDRQVERLRQEVYLLREEIRLKDARMHRIPGSSASSAGCSWLVAGANRRTRRSRDRELSSPIARICNPRAVFC